MKRFGPFHITERVDPVAERKQLHDVWKNSASGGYSFGGSGRGKSSTRMKSHPIYRILPILNRKLIA